MATGAGSQRKDTAVVDTGSCCFHAPRKAFFCQQNIFPHHISSNEIKQSQKLVINMAVANMEEQTRDGRV